MNYLLYIEHSAENLQFFLWFRGYCARFDKLPASEKALAPEWTQAQIDAEATSNSNQRASRRVNPTVASSVFKDTDFADGAHKGAVDKVDPFNTPEKSSIDEKRDVMSSEYSSSAGDDRTAASTNAHSSVAEQAFNDAGMKWKPCR